MRLQIHQPQQMEPTSRVDVGGCARGRACKRTCMRVRGADWRRWGWGWGWRIGRGSEVWTSHGSSTGHRAAHVAAGQHGAGGALANMMPSGKHDEMMSGKNHE